jgi:tetratricopeptide (TPR) repeat protein
MSHQVRRPTDDDITRLEIAVRKNPSAEEPRAHLIEALSVAEGRENDPRRFELIKWFLQHNPRHSIWRTPYVHVDQNVAPNVYSDLKAQWLTLVNYAPSDPDLIRGAAAFIAHEHCEEAAQILRAGIAKVPHDPELWLDLGRASQDLAERLSAFERARDLGETLPNLLVWIAMSAIEANQPIKAERAAHELMSLVDEARARFGDKLDWSERGGALWRRARDNSRTDDEAGALTDAISQHAYRKHWAHTVLGLLACRRDDLPKAIGHLRASAAIRPDYRLSAYGPALELLREVCRRGRWEEGLEYLEAWKRIWDDQRVDEWIAALDDRRLPEKS